MKQTSRAKPGTVGIEDKQGKLRLRLPRGIVQDSTRYLSTGLKSTPENQRLAQMVAWEIEADIQAGKLDPTLGKYLSQFKTSSQVLAKSLDLTEIWLQYCDYMKPQLAVTTYQKDYLRTWYNHIQRLPTKDLRKAVAIRDYLMATVSPGTVKRVLTYLSACCSWAVASGLVSHNPFDGMARAIKTPSPDNDIDPFTLAERDVILAAFQAHPRHYHYTNFARFLFLTGCRLGEAIALQWRHISPDCTQITFCESYDSGTKVRKDTKTHKVRKFPCNPVLQQLLLDIRPGNYQPDMLVFTSPTGLPINSTKFTNQVWRGCKSGSKTYKGVVGQLVRDGLIERYRYPYNCRHTFITMAVEAGIPIPQIAKWVGNSPEIILRHYAGCLAQPEVPVK